MRISHLTDSEVQQYLDGTLRRKDEAKLHLTICGECSNSYKAYQSLYSSIHTLNCDYLEESFAPNLLRRITIAPLAGRTPELVKLFCLIASTAIALAIIVTPFELSSLTSLLTQFDFGRFMPDFSVLNSLQTSLLSIKTSFLMIGGMAGLTMVLFGSLDRLLLSRKYGSFFE
ncbi:MAG: hypothetical protein SGI97_04015 [candidate division Zixibacteria bacterium]|nr:hypothetical protein [candidate division Zixibacteria bacterium]